ncbi:MAG: response regulator [Elusimicrobia bacterium]|nr:response regulator [Candidatus Obscuribacterium magneticum]
MQTEIKTASPKLNVLLIEDSRDYTHQVKEALGEKGNDSFQLSCADNLSQGLERLAQGGVDAILLDLMLPDSQGMETFDQVYAQSRAIPIVVLTQVDDEALAIEALRKGAQDYLVTDEVNANLLVRSISYAIERQQFQLEQKRAQERELRSLERFSDPSRASAASRSYGLAPLNESRPDIFNELVQQYSGFLDLALEQRSYKVDHHISEGICAMVERMGFLRAGPRDVVEIHCTALKRKTKEATPQKAKAYVEEGRVMALELMGHLVNFYSHKFANDKSIEKKGPDKEGKIDG